MNSMVYEILQEVWGEKPLVAHGLLSTFIVRRIARVRFKNKTCLSCDTFGDPSMIVLVDKNVVFSFPEISVERFM